MKKFFFIFLIILSCTDKKDMNCSNIKKETGLPVFSILDKNKVNTNNPELIKIFESIDNNRSDKELVVNFKKDLDRSYILVNQKEIYNILFSTEFDNYNNFIELSFNESKNLIEKFEKGNLSDFEKGQLKFLFFKKTYLYESIHDSWFFDSPFLEFNQGILSDKGKEILLSYYDNGNRIEFEEKAIDSFIGNDYFEENFIEINDKFYPEIILGKELFRGECVSIYNWYKELFKKDDKKEYIIVIYNL